MPPRALFFDLDDTLLETHDSHRIAMRISCERATEHHPDWTPEALQQAFVRTYQELERRLEAGELSVGSQLSFRQTTWDLTLRACGLAPGLAEELAGVYLAERRKRYRLFPDVEAALDELSQRYRLVLVTNGLSELQREKMDAVRLDRWFSHAAISQEVGSWKPDPEIFHHALRLAGVAPGEAVMLGDSLQRDLGGAAAVGIRTIWVKRYAHHAAAPGSEPEHILDTLAGLSALVRDWS